MPTRDEERIPTKSRGTPNATPERITSMTSGKVPISKVSETSTTITTEAVENMNAENIFVADEPNLIISIAHHASMANTMIVEIAPSHACSHIA